MDATAKYLEAEDGINTWIDEECDRDYRAFTKSGTLYASWKSWADRSGEIAGSMKAFSQNLEKRGFQYQAKRDGRGYIGLQLKTQ